MTLDRKYRQCIPESRRVVVKVGSRVLVQPSGRPDQRQLQRLVKEIAAVRRQGLDVVVVSSGAIAAGMEALRLAERPATVPELQMCAAVGQCRLMARYVELFEDEKLVAAQLLLTHDDFARKIQLTNLRRTMDRLLTVGVVPIVNENDVVADEEVRAVLSLGDNDYLASLVARQIRADLLVLLSTTDGLRERDPGGRSRRVRHVETINRATFRMVEPTQGGLSKGGMTSKLKAAQVCTQAGCNVVVASGRKPGVLGSILRGEDVGTLFLASPC